MSKNSRDLWKQAHESWPLLQDFLVDTFHTDWLEQFATPMIAIDKAVAQIPIDLRVQICREWWSWNAVLGWKFNVQRFVVDGLGVNMDFDSDAEARVFMNKLYDALIVSIRGVLGKGWKP